MDVKEQGSSNRMVLLLIAGIPVTVILVATWLWFYVARGELDLVAILGTSNSGTLVQPPRQLDEVEIRDRAGNLIQYSELDPRWTFLIPGSRVCDAACEENLYTTRQIHIAMGKYLNRIRRIYVSDTGPTDTALQVERLSDDRPVPVGFDAFLELEHPGTRALTVSHSDFGMLFSELADDSSSWYLVDPAGWIMMTYDGEVDYKGVMSDLKFLLKNSSD